MNNRKMEKMLMKNSLSIDSEQCVSLFMKSHH